MDFCLSRVFLPVEFCHPGAFRGQQPAGNGLKELCEVCVVTLARRRVPGMGAGAGHVTVAWRCRVQWKFVWKCAPISKHATSCWLTCHLCLS